MDVVAKCPVGSRPIVHWTHRSRVLLAGLAIIAGASLLLGSVRLSLAERRLDEEILLVVDANTVPAAVLEALPEIGPKLAAAIIREREREPFQSLDDLDRRVRGIGPSRARAIGPYLRFDERTP